jgi:hypothetical protein
MSTAQSTFTPYVIRSATLNFRRLISRTLKFGYYRGENGERGRAWASSPKAGALNYWNNRALIDFKCPSAKQGGGSHGWSVS